MYNVNKLFEYKNRRIRDTLQFRENRAMIVREWPHEKFWELLICWSKIKTRTHGPMCHAWRYFEQYSDIQLQTAFYRSMNGPTVRSDGFVQSINIS